MGKMLSGIVAVIFMTGGLTALNIGGASADHGYGPHAATTCRADNLNNPRVGNPARVRFRVATAGNGAPRGTVTFAYERRSSEFVVERYQRRYRGPEAERYAFRGIPAGTYTVHVRFNSNSAYENCKKSFSQRIRRRG